MRQVYLLLVSAIFLISASVAEAATYYVGKSGSDANSCATAQSSTAANRKLTVKAGAACLSAADTLVVGDGTYTENISSFGGTSVSIPSGTSETARTTLKAENNRLVIMNGCQSPNSTVVWWASRQYIKVDGIVFDGLDSCNSTMHFKDVTADGIGVAFIRIENSTIKNARGTSGGTGLLYGGDTAGLDPVHHIEIVNNIISGMDKAHINSGNHCMYFKVRDSLVEHNDISDCFGSGFTTHNVVTAPNNTIFRYNVVHNTSSGNCFKLATGANVLAHNNVCYDNRDEDATGLVNTPIFVYNYGNAPNNKVFNNTVYGSPNTANSCIRIGAGTTNTQVKNNICYAGANDIITNSGTASVISNNRCASGCTTAANPLLVNAGGNNFSLQSSSTMINAGTNVSLAFNGAAPDLGAFETFTYSTAVINEAFLDVTLGMNLNVPVQPTAAGWSAACSGGANCGTPVVASAAKLTGTDSVVRLTLTGLGGGGVCEVGQTWTVSYNDATGATTDSAFIGVSTNSYNQELATFTTQAVTNACSVAPPAPPAGPHIHYKMNDGSGTNLNDETANNLDGTLTGGTWGTGIEGGGVVFTSSATDKIAVPYGSGVNPSTQSLTIAFWVYIPLDKVTSNLVYYGTTIGTNQRLQIAAVSSTWGIAMQASQATTTSNLAITNEWHRLCLVVDSDTATLYANGIAGTGGATKGYGSYTFPANFTIGSPFALGDFTGVIYDGFKLWTSVKSCADDWAAEQPPAPPTGPTLAQKAHQFHFLRQTSGGVVEDYRAQNATVNVVAGGAVMLTTQTDATVAGGSVAERLNYNVDGGAFIPVPDDFTSDGVAFYGDAAATDTDILKGAVATLLAGALTKIDGATQYHADAVPVVPFTTNSSTVQRAILRFAASAEGHTICFKRYTQQGVVYGAATPYTPAAGACVNVIAPAAAGFG